MAKMEIKIRGEYYIVHENGNISQPGEAASGNWKFIGVSFHHWRNGIDIDLKESFKDPSKIIGGLLWDLDHGTKRQWVGNYLGGLPRITSAHLF